MGFFDTPETDDPWLKRYSLFLKFEGQVFGGIIVVAYFLKWGVAWHDAGQPFTVTDISFSAYWDMILIIYTTFGIWITQASFDPVAFKPLLSWGMWGGNFCHDVVAFVHCFDGNGPNKAATAYAKAAFGSKLNIDKLLIAVPLWFGMWAANLFFFKKCFGNYGLPYLANITPASAQYTSKVKQTERAPCA